MTFLNWKQLKRLLGWLIVIVIASRFIYLPFANSEMTDNQLFIRFWGEYLGGVFIIVLFTWRRISN